MPKRDEIGRERKKKKNYFRIPFILDSGKKIPKKVANKLKKIKKSLSDIIFSQNWMRQAEKEKKTFYFRIPLKLDSGKKIPKKNSKKIEKIKKNSFRHYF